MPPRSGGTYTRGEPGAAPLRVAGTEPHPAGDRARAADGTRLNRASASRPAVASEGAAGALPAPAAEAERPARAPKPAAKRKE